MKKIKNFIILLFVEILLVTGCSYNPTTQENKNDNKSIPSETTTTEKTEPILASQNEPTTTSVNNLNLEEENELKIYFIDVGQGDSALLEYNNHYMLIDAGDNSEEEFMVEYLNSKNVNTIDYLIGTHPHADHIGGMDAVIDNFDIEKIYMPNATTTTKTFEDVLDSIEEKNLSITEPVTGTEFMLDDIPIEILSPDIEYDELNNNSIVLKLTYNDISFLFTGDAEELAEYNILNSGYNVSSNVLKVGHHGSYTSTTDEFLNAVNPQYVVISCGKNNRYEHPHKETLQKLENSNREIFRTDEDGTIIFSTTGKNLEIITER